jgi:hypothetical protein
MAAMSRAWAAKSAMVTGVESALAKELDDGGEDAFGEDGGALDG